MSFDMLFAMPDGIFEIFFILKKKISQIEIREAKPKMAVRVMVRSHFIESIIYAKIL